jgi:hypothetical protein
MIDLKQQIDEVQRELALRKNVYPRLVASGKMTQEDADMHCERLRAVLATLEWLQVNKDVIKHRLAGEASWPPTG